MAKTMNTSTVLVAGASGQLGSLLVAALSAEPSQYRKILCLTRSVEKATRVLAAHGVKADGERVVCVVCKDAGDAEALRNVFTEHGPISDVVSCLGASSKSDSAATSIAAGATTLAQTAAAAGAKRFVYTSATHVTRPYSPITLILNTIAGMVLATHATTEDELRKVCSASTSMDLVVVRPGGLDHGSPGPGVRLGQGDTINGSSVQRAQVAACITAALSPENIPHRPTEGVTFEIVGDSSKDSESTDWKAALAPLQPDAPLQPIDHMQEHQRALTRVKCGAAALCVGIGAAAFAFLRR